MMVAVQLGGTAGMGVESAGGILVNTLAHKGYGVSTQRDFPSRIRGGDTTITIRVDAECTLAPPSAVKLGIALNDTVAERMQATTLLDPNTIPLSELATEAGDRQATNLVALGAIGAALHLPLEDLEAGVRKRFSRHKDREASNTSALQLGYAWGTKHLPSIPLAPPASMAPQLVLTGNQSFGLGAVMAGCRFMAAYPITPASDMLEFLTPKLQELGGVAVQLEDEMAALNACLGAGFAGAAAMTATSGPGFSVMTETLGFAEAAEIPCVVVDAQRPGPASGMPTKHGQEDLLHAAHGGHGESPRIVLSPLDVVDSFRTAVQSFDLARRFRQPIIVLLDQQLSLMQNTCTRLPTERLHEQTPAILYTKEGSAWKGTYEPYAGTGREPHQAHSIPGQTEALFYANSTEHGTNGFTLEAPAPRAAMVQRRLRKQATVAAAVQDAVVVEGQPSDTVVLTWGSTMGAAREAAREAAFTLVGVRLVHPLPVADLEPILGKAKRILVVEANGTGQLATLLRSSLPMHDKIESCVCADGLPLGKDEILEALHG